MVTDGFRLRAAEPSEAGRLTDLVLRSKASWGYDRAFLDACRDELRIRPDEVLARRTVVADHDGTPVGVVTLDGRPPYGEIGLLFVDPDVLRQGVGQALYRHVLAEAGRLGFHRLTIGADPHAVPFYRALGAEPAVVPEPAGPGELVRMLAWPPAPTPSWSTVWNGPDRPIVVGNAAEFNAQFGGRLRGPDHYSCLAVFGADRPATVLLPMPVEEWWTGHVSKILGWTDVEVVGGLAGDGRMDAAIAESPVLTRQIASGRKRVRPWGWTPGLAATALCPAEVLTAMRDHESKSKANALFHALAADHPGIRVLDQREITSSRRLRRELAAGERMVLKRRHGVGGDGTLIVSAGTPGLRRQVWDWMYGGALLEEFVEGDPVTFDAVVAADGWVHPVGTGLMHIDATAYRGVTVGPGVLPDEVAGIATTFGVAVGRALSAAGYRGWYDVDFVAATSGQLTPTEINLRLTGPAAAFHIQVALDRSLGGRHVVRTVDQVPLGARLPSAALREHVDRLTSECRGLGATLLVTIPTAAFDAAPYLGVAVAARTAQAVTGAETAVRQACAALGELFSPVTASVPAAGSVAAAAG
ncbi:GNAT family N-acetyltransferase [Actinoplanes sp. NPDC026670]|uniref:GNAT family N-acetyltransferase n=1 Tax=Actinoplanes sp. NPDC026670 TaxID=3154700 RepID=UPI0033E01385